MTDRQPIVYAEQKKISEQGLELLQEDNIKCANCNRILLQVIKVREDPSIINVLKASCPFCGDSSFKFRVDGAIYISSVEGTSIKEAPIDFKEGVLYSDIEVIQDVKI